MNMRNNHYPSNGKKRQNRGFAIAAGICLIAIGAAAWSAYDSVVQEPLSTESEVSISETIPTEDGISLSSPTPVPEKEAAAKPAPSPSPTPEATPSAKPSAAAVSIENMELSFPVGQKVLKRFSDATPVYSDTMKDWRVHNGVDFEAESGQSVKSMAQGTVKEILQDSMLGNVVVITHGDADVWYCGLGSKVLVKEGSQVSAGDEIGTVGVCPAESADASHFHLEVHRGEEVLDPLALLMKEEK